MCCVSIWSASKCMTISVAETPVSVRPAPVACVGVRSMVESAWLISA